MNPSPGPRPAERSPGAFLRARGGEREAARVTSIRIYPVKGCAGLSLPEAEVDATGFLHDRRWMVVEEKREFLSQRSHPRLALVRPELRDQELILASSGQPSVPVPLRPEGEPEIPVRVWGDEVAALAPSPAADRWLSRFLGVSCRLVWLPPRVVRPVDPRYARPGDRVAFADAFPFLLLSEESLEALNARLPTPLGIDRFRPNLVVRAAAAHAEDGWRHIRVGEVELDVAKPCARCAVTTVDQATGERGTEPLRTLASYRRWEGQAYFGQNLVHRSGGRIRVGDPVRVLESGPPRPPIGQRDPEASA